MQTTDIQPVLDALNTTYEHQTVPYRLTLVPTADLSTAVPGTADIAALVSGLNTLLTGRLDRRVQIDARAITPPVPTAPPSLSADTTTPQVGDTVTFTIRNAPRDATLTLDTDVRVPASSSVAHTYTSAGNRAVALWDGAGGLLATLAVTVAAADVTLALSPGPYVTGGTLTATLTGVPANATFRWGEGPPVTLTAGDGSVSHVYASVGNYTLEVRAADGAILASRALTVGTPSIGITWQPPITITRGGVYAGAWQNTTDPTKWAIKIDTTEPVVIEAFDLRSVGLGITSRRPGARVTIRNGGGQGLNPNVRGRSQDRFVDVQYAKAFEIEHLTFDGFTGIYINKTSGMTDADAKFIRFILGRNVNGQYSDGNGGYLTGDADFFRGQLVQLNNLDGVSPELDWLHYEGQPRVSHVEDVINIHACRGKSEANRIRVRNVLIDGAFAWRPEGSYTGGGVMFGDGGGSNQESDGVIVLEASNYALAAAGGSNLRHKNFLALGAGKLPDGTLLDKETDAGLYARPYSEALSNVEFVDGTVGWGNPSTSNPNARWDSSIRAGAVMVRVANEPAGPITEARKQRGRQLFAQRVAAASVTIGRLS